MEKRSKQEVRKDHWFLAGLFVLIAALAGVMASEMKSTILNALSELDGMSGEDLRNQRYDKFRKMGSFIE